MKILVVEDEMRIRKLIRMILEKEGHSVWEAADGIEAQRLLTEVPFDVLVTDLVMPRLGGVELVMRIRRTASELRVIFVSGYVNMAASSFKNLTDAFGVAKCLQKPFQVSELVAAVYGPEIRRNIGMISTSPGA